MIRTPLPSLLEELERGIAELTNSARWRHYLDVQGRFHEYSYGNALLIASQRTGATRVAGYRTWRQVHRFVRKGEKAIWIFAPIVDRGGGGEDDRIRGFKLVPVFDVSQTDGAPLESVVTRLMTSDPRADYSRLVAVARSIGFRVCDHRFDGSTSGDCSHPERRIRVEKTNSPAQRIKTLAHELAHALLHESVDDRARAELEAESTAYIVCSVLGIDSGEYSFGYLATWAGGGTEAISGIKASCGHIQHAAGTILEQLERLEPAGSASVTSGTPGGTCA
jgi:antirestriction protein ArdC